MELPFKYVIRRCLKLILCVGGLEENNFVGTVYCNIYSGVSRKNSSCGLWVILISEIICNYKIFVIKVQI